MGKLSITRVKKLVRGKSQSISKGIDTAVTKIDKQTKGKYSDKLTKGAESAKSAVSKLDEDAPAPTGSTTENAGGADDEG